MDCVMHASHSLMQLRTTKVVKSTRLACEGELFL